MKSADGPIANPGELWTPLMMNIARVKAGEISQSKAESLFFKGGFVNSIVVLPIGGVFSREEPIVIGSNCVLGHISRETESAIDALAQSATPPLLGFHLNNDVEWTQEFLDAEADEYVAEAIEEELMESAGWMPLLMAIKLKAVGTTASIWAIDVAQVLAGALWLASLDDNFSDRSYPVAPWICGGDGPVKPYDLEGYTFNPTQTLRTDLTNARPDLPEGDKWYTYPHASPVSIEDVIEAGWIPAILRVVEAALSESRCVEDISVARSCQFIYTSLHATSWAMRDHLQLLAARSLDAKTFDLSLKESCFASFGLPEAPFGAASIAAVRNALKNMK
ncbi:hypothetical protein ACSDR0_45905 [Streptosporangium sp. G11]|uniref:hypothetical protein n=1 Tax=Streptosporangium sp. G11 TaxID=3436926 RepID=UPI003EBDCAA4